MGACEFSIVGEGKTAEAAFRAAKATARYYHGHGGYSGTIAEKSNFFVVYPDHELTRYPELADVDYAKRATALADAMLSADDKRIANKWGPCGCVELGPGRFLFFGYASS